MMLIRSIVYNSGMSLKDVGKSYSYINRENEEIFIQDLLKSFDLRNLTEKSKYASIVTSVNY